MANVPAMHLSTTVEDVWHVQEDGVIIEESSGCTSTAWTSEWDESDAELDIGWAHPSLVMTRLCIPGAAESDGQLDTPINILPSA